MMCATRHGVAFLGWGLWGFLAEKQTGNVVAKCEDTQASGALPPLPHPCFFPVMSPGLHPVTSRNCLPAPLPPTPTHLHPETSVGLGLPGLRFLDVPCFCSAPKTHTAPQVRAEGPHFVQLWPGA